METSLTGDEPQRTNTFFILSISSWIMLLITSWMPILVLGATNNELIYIFQITKIKYFYKYEIEPLDINFPVFNLIIVLILVIETLGFLIYLLSISKRDNNVLNGLFGETSKFHFIPLFLVSAVFIIGESYSDSKKSLEAKYIFNLIFTFLAIIALIFVSFRTKIESPLHAALTIKGTFSCFLAFLIYNFGYTFTVYGIFKKNKNWDDYHNWMKRCTLAFTILIGILNNAAAFLLKEASISLITLLIYLGMTINYFRWYKEYRKYYLYKNDIVGIFDIIMMIISAAYIAFHIFRYRGIVAKQNY